MAGAWSDRNAVKRELRELTRINELLLEVTNAIIKADSREALESSVCERLAASEPFLLAWIGELDAETGRIEPRTAGGVDPSYLDEIDIDINDPVSGRGPTGMAMRTREPQVMQDILGDPKFEPWREAAIERGFQSSAAFPLVSGDDLYGVLNIYADRPDVFTPSEIEILRTVAEQITFAIRQHQSRAELIQSQELLSIATTAGNVGVWDWNLTDDTVTVDSSWERLFGIEPGGFEGSYEGFANRIKAEDQPAVERAIEAAIATNDRYEREFRIVRDDDAERWLIGLGTVIPDEHGEPKRLVGVNVDITDRKSREQHLRVLDRVLRHNIRNILNVISGNAELIRERSDGEVAEFASQIIQSSSHLLDTAEKERRVVEILTEQPGKTRLELVATIKAIIAGMEDRYPAASVEYHGPAELEATVPEQFRMAIEELVENAIIHNDEPDPHVRIDVDRTGERVHVRVSDNGPRIPEMNIGVLTGDGDIRPLYHGSGLGLWLVHWIVRRGDGSLEFEEDDPKGNVVTATFTAA